MIQHSSRIIISSIFLLSNNANLSFHFRLQTLIFAYWLLNVTQPGCFGDYWLCAPPGTSSKVPLTASNLTSPFTNCLESSVAMTPYLFLITLFDMENYFKASGTHFVGALNHLDYNKILNLDTPPQLSALPLKHFDVCSSQVYHYLPASWSGV